MQEKEKIKPIKSIYHALQVLEEFKDVDNRGELGVTELSKSLGLHKNNIFRLLATLESRGYIEQNLITENYRLGTNIFNLGQKYVEKLGILNLSKPFMDKIVTDVSEAVYIGILRKGTVVYLHVVEPKLSVKVASRVGKDVPAYCTAIGKIQLSYASEEEINKIYMGARLKKYTPNTITSLPTLKEHLRTIMENDYAIDNEEFEEGVKCISVPIKDYLGVSIAALSITGPSYRMTDDLISNSILPVAKKYSLEISKKLGFGL